MADPDTAGLDPAFWLHHCNIDRLWEVWKTSDVTHMNPTDPKWLQGPSAIGEPDFVLPKPNGEAWTYKPSDVVDMATLGYSYDDVLPLAGTPHPARRLEMLRAPMAAAHARAGVQL